MSKHYLDLESGLEKIAVEFFTEELGWEHVNCLHERTGEKSDLGRASRSEALLPARLRPALEKLNAGLPEEIRASVVEAAVEFLLKDRSAMSLARANREIFQGLRDGIQVNVRDENSGATITETAAVIDWENPENNDFLLAQQFWVTGELYKRRADLVGFVNGIPLVFIELKAHYRNLKSAFDENFTSYKNDIPQLFHGNGVVLLSNGDEGCIGTITAPWEHFSEWKRINSEGERGVISMDTLFRGVCEKSRLLDIVENFTLFSQGKGGLGKITARNHQYLGVNNAMDALAKIEQNKGRLGVFWHTQGSGKSYSMVFFTEKVRRKVPGNWTFLIVTDRDDLDGQIYQNFTAAGAVTEDEKTVRAQSGEHLKQLLGQEDHQYLFTLIQKFRHDRAERYPVLSERSDIIVITDEAHRSQYDILAQNMRDALPNAAFIGFTGTPLLEGEERTREVFGDYVSIYNFRQSIEDKATVPLFYENRIPELQLTNPRLNEDMAELIEAENLTPEQQARLDRDFAREYHLLTRADRLKKIAQDLVEHFMNRGYAGKAMVISIDKAAAVRMYDEVKFYWKEYLNQEKAALKDCPPEERRSREVRVRYMEETEMAVVVSASQNEEQTFQDQGLDIMPHRRRMVKENLEEQFKDPEHPFRIVFVCAMWITGFDVPSCNTIYLDKPMKNHTLMQTIARANRVFQDKKNGLIVDYVGVFRKLEEALAVYAEDRNRKKEASDDETVDSPIKHKHALKEMLDAAVADALKFCEGINIDLKKIAEADLRGRLGYLKDAADQILVNDDTRREFRLHASLVENLLRSLRPQEDAEEYRGIAAALYSLMLKVSPSPEDIDISEVTRKINRLLDLSIAAEGYIISDPDDPDEQLYDLSRIDFDALAAQFKKKNTRRNMELEKLRRSIERKLLIMLRLNQNRMNYYDKFTELINSYNRGSHNIQKIYEELLKLANELNQEAGRAVKEGLNEEELAIFDLLTKPAPKLKPDEENKIKKIARELLEVLKREKLVLDWRKKLQARAQVQLAIATNLESLPQSYDEVIYEMKCQAIYDHVFESYFGDGKSIYQDAG